jgi:transcriptional regulator with XRE-family HTH domain
MGVVFGDLLKEAREAAGLTGNGLAMASGIPQGTISGLERGTRPPSKKNLEELAAVSELNVTLTRVQAWAAADRAGAFGLALILMNAGEFEKLAEIRDQTQKILGQANEGYSKIQELRPAGSSPSGSRTPRRSNLLPKVPDFDQMDEAADTRKDTALPGNNK